MVQRMKIVSVGVVGLPSWKRECCGVKAKYIIKKKKDSFFRMLMASTTALAHDTESTEAQWHALVAQVERVAYHERQKWKNHKRAELVGEQHGTHKQHLQPGQRGRWRLACATGSVCSISLIFCVGRAAHDWNVGLNFNF